MICPDFITDVLGIYFSDLRQNKGSILKASVDYIRKLRKDQERHRQIEDKLRQAEAEKRKMFLRMQVMKTSRVLLLVIVLALKYLKICTCPASPKY